MGTAPSAPVQPYVPFIHPPVVPAASLQSLLIIANPRSGGGQGRVRVQQLLEALRSKHVAARVLWTERPGHAIELAACAVAGGLPEAPGAAATFDAVAAVGGDGTAHEVINGLLLGAQVRAHAGASTGSASIPPVLLVPCGSGNTLAFNIGTTSLEDAVRALEVQRPYLMDVIELTPVAAAGGVVPPLPPLPMACMGTEVDPTAARRSAGVLPQADGAQTFGERVSSSAVAITSSAPPDMTAAAVAAAVAELRTRVCYSVNMVGWGLSSAVLETANSLRWCGSAQYNCAAYVHVASNRSWVAGIDWVDPGYPLAVDAAAFHDLSRHVHAAKSRGRSGGRQQPGASQRSLAVAHDGAEESKSDGAPAVTLRASGTGSSGAEAAALLPLRAPPSDVAPYLMLQVQNTTYMGEKIAFCPFARLDDGLMDVCVVKPASRAQLIDVMETAKACGQHVLGTPGGRGPSTALQYAQARELVFHPVDASQLQSWKRGHDLVTTSRGIEYSSEPADAATLRQRVAARKRLNISDEPMMGPNSINVDGELSSTSPVRMRVLNRVVPMLCCPRLAE